MLSLSCMFKGTIYWTRSSAVAKRSQMLRVVENIAVTQSHSTQGHTKLYCLPISIPW